MCSYCKLDPILELQYTDALTEILNIPYANVTSKLSKQ